jgi:hypothetical protein
MPSKANSKQDPSHNGMAFEGNSEDTSYPTNPTGTSIAKEHYVEAKGQLA